MSDIENKLKCTVRMEFKEMGYEDWKAGGINGYLVNHTI
jgi:hypothetical protein